MNLVQPIKDKDIIEQIKQYLGQQSERNRMLFVTGCNVGLRIGDLLTLKVGDFRGKTHLKFVPKKSRHFAKKAEGKTRLLKINPYLAKEMNRYIKGKSDEEYLFPSRQGKNKPLGRGMAYRILKAAGEHFGLQDIGTHTMRKTFGYWYYQQNHDLEMLRQWFGHTDESTTRRYIGLDQEERDKSMERFRV